MTTGCLKLNNNEITGTVRRELLQGKNSLRVVVYNARNMIYVCYASSYFSYSKCNIIC